MSRHPQKIEASLAYLSYARALETGVIWEDGIPQDRGGRTLRPLEREVWDGALITLLEYLNSPETMDQQVKADSPTPGKPEERRQP